MVVTLGQQYNIGEKPTVMLYTYINRHYYCTASTYFLYNQIIIADLDAAAAVGYPGRDKIYNSALHSSVRYCDGSFYDIWGDIIRLLC